MSVDSYQLHDLDQFFEFQIGDHVAVKGWTPSPVGTEGDSWRIRLGGRRNGWTHLLVVERRLQQCPGGAQCHYMTRAVGVFEGGFDYSKDYTLFNEAELEAVPDHEVPTPGEGGDANPEAKELPF